jgi:membrane fusion protein (multidrug efflux system)
VPQRAVAELQGGYQVAVVDRQNKVVIRPVRVAERVDNLWVIDEGVKAGERVIAEGLQKVRPGTIVTTKAFAFQSGTNGEAKAGAKEGPPGSAPGPKETGQR